MPQVGDELASIDPAPGEAHNYFALLEYTPGDLLRKLVKSKGCSSVAVKVATLLGVDLVEEVLTSCLPALKHPEYLQYTQAARCLKGKPSQEPMKKSEGFPDTQEQQDKGQADTGASKSSIRRPIQSSRSAEENSNSESEDETVHSDSAESVTSTGKLATSPEPLCGCATCQVAHQSAQDGRASTGRKSGSSNASEESASPFSQGGASLRGPENEEAVAESSILGVMLRCRAAEGIIMSEKQRAEASENNSGKPYGSDLDAAELDKVMANRKARMPGLPSVEEAEGYLTLDLLEKIAALAPLRAFFAAIVHLFARHDCLYQGPVPVLLASGGSSSQPGTNGRSGKSKEKKSRRTRNQEKGQESQEELSDYQLRDFAIRIAAEKHPILQRWLQLQIDSIDSLRHLQSSRSLPI